MKHLFFLFAMFLFPSIISAQNIDGDWKGNYISSYSKIKIDVIFHIIGNECSEENVFRSAAQAKESMKPMQQKQDSIFIYKYNNSEEILFKGKLVKGVIKGIYYSNEPYNITLNKFGEGVISVPASKRVNKNKGLVVY